MCKACDAACSGDWSSVKSGEIVAICIHCFWKVVGRNDQQAEPLAEDWESVAVHEMHAKNHLRQTELFSRYPKFGYDLDSMRFFLRNESNQPKWSMPLELIGSFLEDDGSWAWGWENNSLPQSVRASSHWLKGQIELLNAQSIVENRPKLLSEAWHLAYKAGWLLGARSVYRVPNGSLHIFLSLGEEEPVS